MAVRRTTANATIERGGAPQRMKVVKKPLAEVKAKRAKKPAVSGVTSGLAKTNTTTASRKKY